MPDLTGRRWLSWKPEFAPDPLVGVEWLKGQLERDDLVILDIRGRRIDDVFTDGHIPGAVWTAYPGGWRGTGEIPGAVPDHAQLRQVISDLGITLDSTVIIVASGQDGTDFGGAARVYWTLAYAGLTDTAILDGGWAAWESDAAAPRETGTTVPIASDFEPELIESLLATTGRVARDLGTDTVLVDARSEAQFSGAEKSAAARVAGHIPGAINRDNADFFDDLTNWLRPLPEISALVRQDFRAGSPQIIVYCNAGHWSATSWFVLHELLGLESTALYVDSMVGWTLDPARPVAR